MKNTLISYIVLTVVTMLAGIEHILFNIYPVSPASKAIDDMFAYVIGIAMIGTIIAHAVDYFEDLKKKREENKINK